MEEFIFQKKYSLSPELCDEIIELFNNQPLSNRANINNEYEKYSIIPMNTNNTLEDKIVKCLNKELQLCVSKYNEIISNKEKYKSEYNYDIPFNLLNNIVLFTNEYSIIKYQHSLLSKDKKHFTYHLNIQNDTYSKCTFIWYLNDVYSGGETTFMSNQSSIVPEKGKIVLFPSTWCYAYKDNIPIHENKYIMTGFLQCTREK